MPRIKALITVTTYPLPSRSYDELVCTAGVLENGEWIRIYPVPLSFLKGEGRFKFDGGVKYTWVELDLKRRTDDFRPESYSPVNYNFNDFAVIERLDTKGNWLKRKEFCLANVYNDLSVLIEESKAPTNKSLATYKPKKIIGLEWEEDEREWKNEWQELRKQGDLFASETTTDISIPKLPYKFFYRFEDASGQIRRLMIEDWEIGQLYWNCLRAADGNEGVALQKVKEKYEDTFLNKNDVYLFLGTTREWHMRRAKNPFVIIGVFYPKLEMQTSLF